MSQPRREPASKPARMRVRVEHSGRDLVLRDAHREWAGGCFLLLWLCGWTVGCVFLAGMVLAEPTPLHILFALPFWSAEIFVIFLVTGMLFGSATLRLSPAGLDYEQRALVRLTARHVPLDELRDFQAGSSTSPRSNDDKPQGCLCIATLGQPLEYAAGVDEHELEWLGQLLREHLATLQHGTKLPPPSNPDDVENGDDFPPRAVPVSRAEVLRPTCDRSAQPSDSAIVLLHDWEGLRFRQRGACSLLGIGVATFMCLFWNSIVGVFVYALVTEFNWFLLFFLIPFEAVGLLLIAAWVVAVTAPAWVCEWSFSRHEIRCRWSVLGIGPKWRYPVEEIQRIELLRASGGGVNPRDAARIFSEGQFDLSLVGPDNVELVRIDDLTEGEARWMADELFSHFPHWFRR